MRIEALSALVVVVWLTVVLYPKLIAANNLTLNSSFHSPREHHFEGRASHWVAPLEETAIKRLTYREMQTIIRQEGGDEGNAVDCCPTVEEMIEPLGGRNRQEMYVELYRDGENAQRFYEYSCRPDILDKPCRFIDRKLSEQSRCVQKYSYTYAIVQNPMYEGGEGRRRRRHYHHRQNHFPALAGDGIGESSWTLDYIRVRSGCSCEITPKPKRMKKPAHSQLLSATHKSKRRNKLRTLRDDMDSEV